MRYSEWLAVFYFAYLGAAGCVRRLPTVRRASLLAVAVATSLTIVALAHSGSTTGPAWRTPGVAAGSVPGSTRGAGDTRSGARDWIPAAWVLIGYFASGLLAVAPSHRFESWLVGWDRRWLGDVPTQGASRFAAWPRWFLAYLDVVYMGCFLLIPAGFAALAWRGYAALADRYWLMVLASEFGAFAPLAFVEARPPWALEPRAVLPDRAIHRAASHWVRHLTIGVNTFPSGHVAGSLAVALAIIGVVPWIGTVFLVVAVSIAIACVVGRYHYVIDVIAGALLAGGVWAVASILGV